MAKKKHIDSNVTEMVGIPFLQVWMSEKESKDRDFVEVFSGRGEISRAMREVAGFNS